jgi:hypothetical protein
MGQILSGNKSDKEWNPEAALKMFEFFDKKGSRPSVWWSGPAMTLLKST